MKSEKKSGNNGNSSNQLPPGGRGFSVEHMDITADPLSDFYTYAAGSWISSNPIPSDKSHWGTFEELRQTNDENLGAILERCASDKTAGESDIRGRLGRFFRSAMNTEVLERLGFDPLSGFLKGITEISSKDDLLDYMVRLHSTGAFVLFRMFSRADKRDSSVYSLYLYQGGIALPNRDYYISESFEDIRKSYVAHIKKIFSMAGEPSGRAERVADTVMSVETEFAKSARSQADLRDAEKNYNRVLISELGTKYPSLKLDIYIDRMGFPKVDFVVIGQPEFFESLDRLVSERSLDDLKDYFRWTLINAAAPYLFSEIEDEHFDMFVRKLRGQKEAEPRWKRAVRVIDQCVGESLGELYVKEHFGREAREKMGELVTDIRSVFSERLKTLPWMTDTTRKQALSKFERFRTKIGHPEKFRDYSSVVLKEDDYFGNVSRSFAFEISRQVKRVGGPVDREEWLMTPPTVNAYFSPPDNEIVFPAGILQPPFFDVSKDDAVNYGAIGAVISHEITHGYDDQGSRYDENGNLRDWWTDEDKKNFTERAKKVVDLYGSLEVLPGFHVNGELTLGENIADFGGVSIAYDALRRHLARYPELKKKTDGLTPEQRFFISWAQIWKENMKEPEIKMRVTVDPHSPNRFRATIPPYNHPDFEKSFADDGPSEETGEKRKKIDIW